jgi:hypothetical protein
MKSTVCAKLDPGTHMGSIRLPSLNWVWQFSLKQTPTHIHLGLGNFLCFPSSADRIQQQAKSSDGYAIYRVWLRYGRCDTAMSTRRIRLAQYRRGYHHHLLLPHLLRQVNP